MQSELGCSQKVAEEVWEDMFRRDAALCLDMFLSNNYDAMEDGSYYDVKTRNGEMAFKGRTGNFKQAKSIYHAQLALINMANCYRQIWPENYTAEVLQR